MVDMLTGFLEPGHNLYCGDEARKIIPSVQGLIKRKLGQGSKLFFICDNHDPDDLEFKVFPVHCVSGTEEAEVIPELAHYPGEVVPKKRYSAFFNTNLGEKLGVLNPEKVVICGVCTDICVMHTASDARNRDYVVEVPTDCVATFDPEAHKYALQHMEKILGVRLTTSSPVSLR